MAPTPALYQRPNLIGIVQSLLKPKTFFLDRWFPTMVTFDTENVALDIEIKRRRVAAFCSPMVAGKVVAEGTFRTREIAPSYINEVKVMRPLRSLTRAIGETIGGNDAGRVMTPMQRHMERLLRETTESIEAVVRRKELMAVQALVNDEIIIDSEGVPTRTVRFGRDPALKITLAPGAKWSDAGTDPGRNIDSWMELVHKSEGAKIQAIVMDPDSWAAASSNETFLKKLDVRRAEGYGPLAIGPTSYADGPVFKGMWGDVEVWVYSDYYDGLNDQTGEYETLPFLPSGTVLGMSSQIEGTQLHGAIMDEAAGITALPYFPDTWTEKNPNRRLLQIQSAPLVAPKRPNASFSAKVL